MNKKKTLALIIAIFTVFSNIASMNVYAQNVDVVCEDGRVTYNKPIIRDMTAEEMQKVNNGIIQPIIVDDLDAYMKNMETGTIDITNKIKDIPTISTYATMSSKKTIGVDPVPVPPVYINCQITYTTKTAPAGYVYFASVSNISSWLTGLQIPVSYAWSQTSSDKSFTTTKRVVTVTISGVLDTYIIFEGVGKILSQNRSYSFRFSLV